MKDETIKELPNDYVIQSMVSFMQDQGEHNKEWLNGYEVGLKKMRSLVNQSLTEQNQKLVNEAVKMREAFNSMKKSYFEALVCDSDLSLSQEDYFNEIWDKKAGLTINEKGEG